MANIDEKTVDGFGCEWASFDQTNLSDEECHTIFSSYFKIFPSQILNDKNIGVDIGCGSGRWAKIVAPKVKKLYCVDASEEALEIAKKNLSHQKNVDFINASVDQIPIDDESMDFAYSLGVLHHIPDTFAGIQSCVKKLKIGAPFLVYLYYAFDDKPHWFRFIWKLSDYARRFISKLPFKIKLLFSQIIAFFIYFPLARSALLLEKLNFNISHFPLSAYRKFSLYTMRTDALDRFGTRLEHRFTKNEIITMLKQAGLVNITVNEETPCWCAIGYKAQ